jgi:hypothetical protein
MMKLPVQLCPSGIVESSSAAALKAGQHLWVKLDRWLEKAWDQHSYYYRLNLQRVED